MGFHVLKESKRGSVLPPPYHERCRGAEQGELIIISFLEPCRPVMTAVPVSLP